MGVFSLKKNISGRPEPTADTKKNTEAMINDFLRPKRVAKIPEIMPPIIQPISALETVAPW
ncbi:hypothetical protein SDC9_210045 [bioreactor metagenome]|uniref:Uncharacterized protein n=1 Tax=bioreactor metagenome TaxID=1076179 RepID=A0A645JF19_9ZZZZ